MMPKSSYNLIDMSKQYYIKQKEEAIRQTKAAYASAKSSSDKKILKNRITFLKKEFVKLRKNRKQSQIVLSH